MAAQIKMICFLLTMSEPSEQGKKLQFLVSLNIFGLKSRDSRAFSEKSREKLEHKIKGGKSRNSRKSRAHLKA